MDEERGAKVSEREYGENSGVVGGEREWGGKVEAFPLGRVFIVGHTQSDLLRRSTGITKRKLPTDIPLFQHVYTGRTY